MEFRTPLHIKPSRFKIGYDTPGLVCGSCFAERIGQKMLAHKMPVTLNPYGILFNPASIAGMLDNLKVSRSFSKRDLIRHNGRWISLQHHGSFSADEAENLLQAIETATRQGHESLERSNYLIVTWGTAWAYEHTATGMIAANCHKLPESVFRRRRLTPEEIVRLWEKPLSTYLEDKEVIFTVSPVRHLRDGLAENQLSKATLIVAAHTLRERFANCRYFPAYEIMMDDLRDYRFYDRDMTHPSETAADYIWERFCEWTIAPAATGTMRRIEALQQALAHRPIHPGSDAHKVFRQRLRGEIQALSETYPELDFSEELNCSAHF